MLRRPAIGTARWRRSAAAAGSATVILALTACGTPAAGRAVSPPAAVHDRAGPGAHDTTTTTATTTPHPEPLPTPTTLAPFPTDPSAAAQGAWSPAGRPVDGTPAVYETDLVPPGGTRSAGIAWMDTRLLSARLYSGSLSPGGGPYPFTAPVQPAQAATLVAAFNGGFQMKTAHGGYFTTGSVVDPLVAGAASLVIDADGSVRVGAWGATVTMTPQVVAVRQNLGLLVAGGRPTDQAKSPDWQAWGATCGATACTSATPGVEHQWRSGVGVTADGALVYATGPTLAPLQLADLLVRAGVVTGMQLDINPYWTVFVTYDPPTPTGLASPADGSKLLAGTVQGPTTFFEPSWARDFVTMSARPAGG